MTEQEIIDLLSQHEWKDVEFKEAKTAVPKSAYESVSAFANTEGGHLVFGVKKDGVDFEVVGVVDVDRIQNDFITTLRQKDKINQIINVEEKLLSIESKDLLVFYVPEVPRLQKPVYLNKDIRKSFLRKGACDVKCTDDELKRLLNDASKERYDGTTVDYELPQCYSPDDIAWYRRQYESKNNRRSYTDLSDEEFLFQLGLVKESPYGRKPTIASILLFGTDGYLRGVLPRPVIDCQRYLFSSDQVSEERWQDRALCDFNLVQSWRAVIDWYYRFAEIPFEVDPKTLQRKDQPVDYIAFREAIVNMLIHQDYSDHTRKPAIKHFTDQTEFWNPGDAFANVDDLLSPGEKEVRNPLIVNAFRRIGLSENAGWGLREVFMNWSGMGHIPPEIDNDKSKKSFELVLKRELLLSELQLKFQETIGAHLSEDQAKVFAYTCKKGTILSKRELKTVIAKNDRDLDAILNHLITQVLLVEKDGFYELAPVMKARFTSEAHDEAHVDDQEAHDEAHVELNETEAKILQACLEAKSTQELLGILGYKSRTGNYKAALANLLDHGLVEMTLPEIPRSKSQKYVLSEKGTRLLKDRGGH